MAFKFGLGIENPTVSAYLTPVLLPAIERAVSEVRSKQLLVYLRDSGELERWREKKDQIYIDARREAVRKAREDSGMSVEEVEEWTGSESEESEAEQKTKEIVFDPIGFIIESLKTQIEERRAQTD